MLSLPANFVSVFDKPQRDALVMLFLRLHDYGVFANEIFLGPVAVPIRPASLALGIHPSHPGPLPLVACFGHLAFSFTGLLMPQYLDTIARVANIAILGEAPIILWLADNGSQAGPLGAQPRHPRLHRSHPESAQMFRFDVLLPKAGVRWLRCTWI